MSRTAMARRAAAALAVTVGAVGLAGVTAAAAKPAPKAPKIKVPASKPAPKPAPKAKPAVEPVVRAALGQTSPANAVGQELYLSEVTIQPGATLDTHIHEGTQVASIRSGVLTYSIVTGAVRVTRANGATENVTGPATISLHPGDGLVETSTLVHNATNKGKAPVVIMIASLLRQGAGLSTPVPAPTTTPLDFTLQLTSQDRNVKTAGASAQLTYGWNRLTGTTTVDGAPAQVEMQASVDYTSGSGDFFGFVTLTTADGSTLGLRMTDGRTTASADGTNASFVSTLKVIGGTGKYANAKGGGAYTGNRSAAFGGSVESKFHVDLG